MKADAIVGQYRAALAMLRTAIETCPDDLWDAAVGRHAFWLIAYHAMFYTDLYLAGSEEGFELPEFARPDEQYFDKRPDPPHEPIEIGEPYSREQLLAYHASCIDRLEATVPGETEADLAADVSLEWIPFSPVRTAPLQHPPHSASRGSVESGTEVPDRHRRRLGWRR